MSGWLIPTIFKRNVLHKDHQSLSQVESVELRVYSFNEINLKFTLNAILSFFFFYRGNNVISVFIRGIK